MTLDEAKAAIEALPGVHEVTEFVVRDELDAIPVYMRLEVRWLYAPTYVAPIVSFLPEETRRGIQVIQENLDSDPDCYVTITVSAGLRMPGWAAS